MKIYIAARFDKKEEVRGLQKVLSMFYFHPSVNRMENIRQVFKELEI